MCWPVLSIVFVFFLVQYIEHGRPAPANQLSFVFAVLGFAMVAGMISIQLAVRTGMEEYLAGFSENDELLKALRRSSRLVDMGLDVAWDMFIGTSLILLCFALLRHPDFGIWWGIPAGLLGLLLIVLNVITYPWPPDTKGLIDVGPVIGLYIIALSSRLIVLGIRWKHPAREDHSA
jgi:hypothetical protein